MLASEFPKAPSRTSALYSSQQTLCKIMPCTQPDMVSAGREKSPPELILSLRTENTWQGQVMGKESVSCPHPSKRR